MKRTRKLTDVEKMTIAEYRLVKRLITEVYPSGIISIVSDTFDLWRVLTVILPTLKNEVMKRDGKVVIRPDSGDPVDIICGTNTYYSEANKGNLTYYSQDKLLEEAYTPQAKGVVELLWDTFGGTINEKGYKVLDPHVGAIYGDSITLDRAQQINERLASKGFASQVVLGIGSYTYQYNTRDTFGNALKSTYVEIAGKCYETYKDPITDDGTKKSAKGLVRVDKVNGEFVLTDQVSWENEGGELREVFRDGKMLNETSLQEVRKTLWE